MLAVLPFVNVGGDPQQEYLTEGLTDEMITQLGGLQPDRLGVIARTSAMQYKHTAKRIDQIVAELSKELKPGNTIQVIGQIESMNSSFLGLATGLSNLRMAHAILDGVFLGGFVAIILLITRIRTFKDAVPYGPFLVLGPLLVLYSQAP